MHPHPAPKRRGAHGSGARGSGQLQTSVSHASETRIRLPCLTLRPNAQKKTPSRRRLPRHVAAAPHVRPSSETAGTRAARQTTRPHLYTLMQASGSGAPPALSTSRAGMLPCPPRRGDASSSSAGRLESGGRPAGRGRERQYLPSPRHMHIAGSRQAAADTVSHSRRRPPRAAKEQARGRYARRGCPDPARPDGYARPPGLGRRRGEAAGQGVRGGPGAGGRACVWT